MVTKGVERPSEAICIHTPGPSSNLDVHRPREPQWLRVSTRSHCLSNVRKLTFTHMFFSTVKLTHCKGSAMLQDRVPQTTRLLLGFSRPLGEILDPPFEFQGAPSAGSPEQIPASPQLPPSDPAKNKTECQPKASKASFRDAMTETGAPIQVAVLRSWFRVSPHIVVAERHSPTTALAARTSVHYARNAGRNLRSKQD